MKPASQVNNTMPRVTTGWLASRASRRSHDRTRRPPAVYTRSTSRSTTLMYPTRPRGMSRVTATFTPHSGDNHNPEDRPCDTHVHDPKRRRRSRAERRRTPPAPALAQSKAQHTAGALECKTPKVPRAIRETSASAVEHAVPDGCE